MQMCKVHKNDFPVVVRKPEKKDLDKLKKSKVEKLYWTSPCITGRREDTYIAFL